MKYLLSLIRTGVLLSILLIAVTGTYAQIYRVGAGLNFTTGFKHNSVESGNPGLTLKTWIALDKRSTIHIVPSVTAFYPSSLRLPTYTMHNNLFMADLNGQYMTFQDGSVKIVVFAGGNFLYTTSRRTQNDPKYPISPNALTDSTDFAIGGNAGAGLELRMGSHWDMNISIKYTISKYSQFIISAEGVYYFKSRRKAYRRR